MTDFRIGRETTAAVSAMAKAGLVPAGVRAGARRHENRVLASLPSDDLAALARHMQVVSLPSGAVLPHERIGLDHVYFPHQGVVALLAMTPAGEMIEMASAGRGGAMCPIHESEPTDGLLTAIAQGPLRASRLHVTRLHAALAESPALARALAACRETLVLQLRQNLVCCGLHPVEHRLARWLLETAERSESEMIPATQEQVAQRLGVRRTTVTLLASKLQAAGAIRWGRSRIHILDRPRLETLACSCHAALRERTRALLPADPAAGKDLFG
jgi:CRP-like cAMP-binding protein